MVDHVLMEPTDHRIVSYNCRGFNAFKVPFISELLNMCDILLLKKNGYIHHSFVFLQHIFIIIIMLVYVAWMNLLFMLVDHMEDALFYTNHLVLRYILYI